MCSTAMAMSTNPYKSPETTGKLLNGSPPALEWISPRHILMATVASALIVALPMGVTLLIPYLLIIAVIWRFESKRGRAASTLLTYFVITAVVFVGAVLAPIKTTQRILDRRLHLPRTEITIAELDDEAQFQGRRDWLPRYVRVASTPDNAAQWIHFRARNITLREFVDTVERQSNLRHRFAHCGNGSSVLFGGDACFGLYLQERHSSAAAQP
jgi:hypothetical protein